MQQERTNFYYSPIKLKKESTLPNLWKEEYQSYFPPEIKTQATYTGKKMSICFNVICNVIDNISSSHFDNRKNNFLILGEGPMFRTNGSFASPEKRFSINFTKINTKLCLSLHYNAYNNSS